MLEPIDAVKYFHEVWANESLILRFRYSPQKSCFDLVFCYAGPAVSEAFRKWPELPKPVPPRDLRWIRFQNVARFSCGRGVLLTDDAAKSYERTLLSHHPVILEINVKRLEMEYRCDIWVDQFDKHEFIFGKALAGRRVVYAKNEMGHWKYYDVHSHFPVDFFNPFPEIGDP